MEEDKLEIIDPVAILDYILLQLADSEITPEQANFIGQNMPEGYGFVIMS